MDTVKLDEGLYRTVAENGVTVLAESMPGVRSEAVGMRGRTASADGERGRRGVSHLHEHTVFTSTERRHARESSLALEV